MGHIAISPNQSEKQSRGNLFYKNDWIVNVLSRAKPDRRFTRKSIAIKKFWWNIVVSSSDFLKEHICHNPACVKYHRHME
jgi:hypothetical protein